VPTDEPAPFTGGNEPKRLPPATDRPPALPLSADANESANQRSPAGAATETAEYSSDQTRNLGYDLAMAMADQGFHPVVLFGTNSSGKTSLLLSLITALKTRPRLRTGIALSAPILSSKHGLSAFQHRQAKDFVDRKVLAFKNGEKIPKTNVKLPFFIPLEITPHEKPPVRLAFMEGNGEWYSPRRDDADQELFPEFRPELENFVSSFPGPITFLYMAPRTQLVVYKEQDPAHDTDEIQSADLAIVGVCRAYNACRTNSRDADKHMMLVTKWDAHSVRAADRAEELEEDLSQVIEFAENHYPESIAALRDIGRASGQFTINAYCAGLITDKGLRRLPPNDSVAQIIDSYHDRLWNALYKRALMSQGLPARDMIERPKGPPAIVQAFKRILNFMSGS
jgi:hypothetical protein